MQNISRYIIEKLKINKDSKLTDRPFPKEDDSVMILYTNYPKNDIRTFLFGKVVELHKDVEPTGAFSVQYMLNGKQENDLFYFNQKMDPHWIGRTDKPGFLCYDYEYSLKEIEKGINSKKYEFDDEKITSPHNMVSIEDLFNISKKMIEKNLRETK